MRASRLFMPTLKEVPAEAQIISHRLMLRAGMIRQMSSGIYAWLPLGIRVLGKITDIVRREQESIGSNEILMPTIQSSDLWLKSGRYDEYGPEMLRIQDRHGRHMLYGPTNEEMATRIFAQEVKSYRSLPLNLYQIQWKFRDEVRPRFGVMRGREFLMKDGYSFDISREAAELSYRKALLSYVRTFQNMGIKAIPMKADTGPIGGDLSHEFLVLAETGESEVFYDRRLAELNLEKFDFSDPGKAEEIYNFYTGSYARTDETHEASLFEKQVPPDRRVQGRAIEVGHIFYFGTRYSQKLEAIVTNEAGAEIPVHMGSYGIGVSRLVGAIIEACHDERGIVWPEAVAPFRLALINLKAGEERCDAACALLYGDLKTRNIETLYDDRKIRAGGKFADMDLIGVPYQVIVGPRGLDRDMLELKIRATGESLELSREALLSRLVS